MFPCKKTQIPPPICSFSKIDIRVDNIFISNIRLSMPKKHAVVGIRKDKNKKYLRTRRDTETKQK